MENLNLAARMNAIENSHFTQIPDPSPILLPGESGAWYDGMCEMCDIRKLYL